MRSFLFGLVLLGLAPIAVGVGATTVTRLTTGSQIDRDPCFSPDGSEIAFVIVDDIWVMPSSGEPATRRLTSLGKHVEWPAWSPDGSQIVFLVDSQDLWTVPAAGGQPIQLTSSGGTKRHPFWSPDGARIAFAWLGGAGNYDIWAIPASGGTPTQLTSAPSHETDPSWSPDGSQIVFSSDRGGNYEIYSQPVIGGSAIRLTSVGEINDEATWSPDGRWIAFVHRASPAQIWMVPANGDPARCVTDSAGCYDGSPRWSPDGRRLVFDRLSSVPEDIWLATDLPTGAHLAADHPEILSVSPPYVGLGQKSVVVFCIRDSTGGKIGDEGAAANLSSLFGLGSFGPVIVMLDTTYQATYTAGLVPGTDSVYVYDPECMTKQYAWSAIDIIPPPQIVSIKDVPDDQGAKVSVRWKRSAIDTSPDTSITHYSIWRSIPPLSGTGPESLPLVTAADVGPDFAGPGYRVTVSGSNTYYWEWIGNIPAHYFEGYSFTAPTLMDSTSRNPGWHYFLVSAHTEHPFAFRDSKPDSGYSVDNLAPDPPSRVSGRCIPGVGLLLIWDPNSEQDLSHYAIYKGLDSAFVPDEARLIGTVTDTSFVDRSFNPSVVAYYKLTALDIHENQSKWTTLRTEGGPTVLYTPQLAATVSDEGIQITWYGLPDATGYHLYQRKEAEEVYTRITETPIPSGRARYTYELNEYPEVTTYLLLSALMPAGIEVRYGPVVVYPVKTGIVRCSPNPFSLSTQVEYSAASDMVGSLRVYDVTGRLVKTLLDGNFVRGTRSVVWDGSTHAGVRAAAGIYLLRFETDGLVESRKLVLTRQ